MRFAASKQSFVSRIAICRGGFGTPKPISKGRRLQVVSNPLHFTESSMNSILRQSAGAASLLAAASSFAAGNLSVSRETIVERPPATVWKLVGSFDALDVWLPPVRGSSFTGVSGQPGAIRVLDLGNNASVTEKLLSYSAAHHRYSYAFVNSPLPVKNYVATIELHPAAGGKTLVKWTSTFDAAGAPDAKAKEAIQGIYDAGLTRLAAIFRPQQ